MTRQAYPLDWPLGQPRTPDWRRKHGSIAEGMSYDRCLHDLDHEVYLLGGEGLVLSTNMTLRRDGYPRANQAGITDPGVAIFFERDGVDVAMACDVYASVKKNVRGLTLAIQSLRALERHGGGQMLERAFQGFAALPASIVPARLWWDVLGFMDEFGGGDEPLTIDDVMAAFRRRARECHPDKPGGSAEAMQELNRALEQAKRVVGSAA